MSLPLLDPTRFTDLTPDNCPPTDAIVLVLFKNPSRIEGVRINDNPPSNFPKLTMALARLVYDSDGFGTAHPQHWDLLSLSSNDNKYVPKIVSRAKLIDISSWMIVARGDETKIS